MLGAQLLIMLGSLIVLVQISKIKFPPMLKSHSWFWWTPTDQTDRRVASKLSNEIKTFKK